jgi:hypothetical protein
VFRLNAVLRGLSASCLLLLSACDEHISAEQCTALLDRYVELLVASDGRKSSTEEILRLQREARARAAQDPEFARCTEEVSKQEWECAMRAPTADDVERCLL